MTEATIQTHFESLSKLKVEELTRSGGRVIGWHETPPTASPQELWTGNSVRAAFLSLLAAREAEDETGATWDGPRSVRAAAIVSRAGGPVTQWLEFRRIYASFWRAALDSETTEDMVRELCSLTAELDKLASAPETDPRPAASSDASKSRASPS